MSDDIHSLQRWVDQATAAEVVSEADLDPQVRALRDAWIDFGQLLKAAQPAPLQLSFSSAAAERGANLRPRFIRGRRWFLSAAALVTALLLVGVMTNWIPRDVEQGASPLPVVKQATAIKPGGATLVQKERQTASTLPTTTLDGPQWDDSLDEPFAKFGRQMLVARQDDHAAADRGGLVHYGLEQIRKDLDENKL
jgi:hypothetical protein